MYKDGSNVDSKIAKNKFESSINETRKKTLVCAADIDSYGNICIIII